ncbi:hypothetical protein ACTG9Q_20650 [Actinokineospora sp. 24-640]
MRSGAIHATELIDRATGRFPPVRPATHTADDADAVTAVLPAIPADEPDSRGMRLAKLAGLLLAALTLCGTVAAAAVLSGERGERGEPAMAGPAAPITGQRALLPDELAQAVSGVSASPTVPPAATAATTAIVVEEEARGNDGTAPAAGQGAPTTPATAGLSDRELVSKYYRLVQSDPASAFTLLSGTEFGGDLGRFINGWAGVADVEVLEVATAPDGVLAVVRMHLIGGQTLRVEQLFHVTDNTPRRIAGVTLVSAQVG